MKNDDSQEPCTVTISYDYGGGVVETYSETITPEEMAARIAAIQPPYVFEHDAEKGIFRLTWANGEVEVFRDRPVRYLVVEPDPRTGQMRPVAARRDWPMVVYLCREEREVR
jgi:hypothetical protein